MSAVFPDTEDILVSGVKGFCYNYSSRLAEFDKKTIISLIDSYPASQINS